MGQGAEVLGAQEMVHPRTFWPAFSIAGAICIERPSVDFYGDEDGVDAGSGAECVDRLEHRFECDEKVTDDIVVHAAELPDGVIEEGPAVVEFLPNDIEEFPRGHVVGEVGAPGTGAVGIHHVYRAHKLARKGASHTHAQAILDDVAERIEELPAETVEQLIEAMDKKFGSASLSSTPRARPAGNG